MSNLGKRLDALEEIAEEMRLRPYRELAAERGISFATFMQHYEECRARTATLRAQGWTERQIVAATAARLGCTVEELRAECDAIIRRFG